MFTGIITALGTIDEIITKADGDVRLGIMTPWDCTAIPLGASIACSGVCLTVVALPAAGLMSMFQPKQWR